MCQKKPFMGKVWKCVHVMSARRKMSTWRERLEKGSEPSLWRHHALLLLGLILQDLLHQTQFPCLTVTGSSSGFSISACLRNTFPRHTRQSMRSKVGIRSRLITPATKLWGEESGWELQAGRLKTKQERGRECGGLYTAHGVKRAGSHSLDLISGPNREGWEKTRNWSTQI